MTILLHFFGLKCHTVALVERDGKDSGSVKCFLNGLVYKSLSLYSSEHPN